MAKKDFLFKLSSLVDTSFSTLRTGHSVGAYDDRYPCANPEGPVDNSECPEDDPLCNCPCQELNPSKESVGWGWYAAFGLLGGTVANLLGGGNVPEPTDEQVEEELEKCKECDRIADALGEEFLGCMWNNQNHPSSCNCPCRGERFGEYMEYTRTYATYWDTPENTPLWRDAQMFLINAQTATIVLNGDLSLRPGTLIKIVNKLPGSQEPNTRRFSGRWMISSISHIMDNESHRMLIGLSRDSSPIEPDESQVLGWFDSALGWFGNLFD